jgi:hypothetical protein
VLDPLRPLFETHGTAAAAFVPSVADPASARAVMIVGIIIIVATACWAVGGLSAAVWARWNDGRHIRRRSLRLRRDKMRAR